jgi:hypothetical protein
MGERRSLLIRRPESKIPLLRSRHGWEHNIKMNLSEIRLAGVGWIIWLRI